MKHDIFISHASEDKELFVRELAKSLSDKGLAVWYDEFSLKIGDSLSDSIGKGLTNSSFGVVVISPNFLAKKWPKRELAALVAREDHEDKVILPIWHKITKREVLDHLPLIADKVALNSDDGIEAVTRKILEVVKPERIAEAKYKLGRHFEKIGDSEEAKSNYSDAIKLDKNHAAAAERLGRLLLNQHLKYPDARIRLGRGDWFSASKGFGFISGEDGNQYFIHLFALDRDGIRELKPGDPVAFSWTNTKGIHAALAVRIIAFDDL
jgi:cold shock CspA family protein